LILSSQPIIEAIGNAKTVHNDNSSRYGSKINLYFDLKTLEIKGSYFKTYLLEKSRVILPRKNERNFHIFYQVISGLQFLFSPYIENTYNNLENFNLNSTSNLDIKNNPLFSSFFSELKFDEYKNPSSEFWLNFILKTKKLYLDHKGKDTEDSYNSENVYSEGIISTLCNLFNEGVFNSIKKIPNFLLKDKYNILGIDSSTHEIEGICDSLEFFHLLENLFKTKFSPDEICAILRTIIFILLLGNVEFESCNDPSRNKNIEDYACKICSDSEIYLETACLIMELNKEEFTNDILLYNIFYVGKEAIKKKHSLLDCYNSRNSFIKEIYMKLFDFIIGKLNELLFTKELQNKISNLNNIDSENDSDNSNSNSKSYKNRNNTIKSISILDIYGFEDLDENYFEQFCINYANEKLKQIYIKKTFKDLKEVFIEEDLSKLYEEFPFNDNIEILDLIDKDKTGLISILENECKLTKSDENFLNVKI
jgi:myosin heavy subunit